MLSRTSEKPSFEGFWFGLKQSISLTEFRQIFSRDITCNHSLTALYAFCLAETQAIPHTVIIAAEFLDLKPYEIVVDFGRVERELVLSREQCLEKLGLLERLRRVRIHALEKYARMEFLNLSFPINPTRLDTQPETGLIAVTFPEWKEIDLKEVKRQFSRKYLELVEFVLRTFGEIANDKPLSEVTRSDYTQFVQHMQRRGISNTSVNNYTRALKASFRRGLQGGYLAKDPFKGVKPLPQSRKTPVIINRDEYTMLRTSIPEEWLRLLVDMAILTGMRRDELINLRWNDLDFDRDVISIRCSADFHPKFSKEREFPLTAEANQIFQRARQFHQDHQIESEFVFVDELGAKLKGDRVTKKFKSAVRFTGLREELHFHCLRRTFSTRLKQKGTDTNTIKGILGHASTKTTDRYIGTPSDDMKRAISDLRLSDFVLSPPA